MVYKSVRAKRAAERLVALPPQVLDSPDAFEPAALRHVAIVLSFLNATKANDAEVLFDYRDIANVLCAREAKNGPRWAQKLDTSRRNEIVAAMKAVGRVPNTVPGWAIEIEPDYRFLTLRARRLLGLELASAAAQ